ncbi:MAG: hypothetical protein FWG42_06850 [Clostridiales bacterium]|nr:hypothetical protein [Clostridiales bacterium]
MKKLGKVTEPAEDNNRRYRGFNFFSKEDERLLVSVADGKFTLKGITYKYYLTALGKQDLG